ncbi:MAG TPA: alpha/beta fold hydrolase [Candidatus Methylomirabilis sp.]|nr:alpha/beta fold hydrolase [Candidatus Methylomirabilis sp.]
MKRLLFILGLTAAVLAGCNGAFFYPDRTQMSSPDQLGLKYEDVYFPANDGTRLHAWFLPAVGKAMGTILFLHGNAENISTHIMSVHWLPAQGFNVFLLDYRGYGASQGEPSVEGVQEDVAAAMRTLLSRPDVDPDRIVVFGQSLGGSIAIYNVAHTPYRSHIRALAVESAFASYRDIAREKLAAFWLTWPLQYPLSWTVADTYSPAAAVAQISPIPLLIIHGDRDPIVPVEHAKRLFELAREPKQLWIVPGGGHIQAFQYQNYRDRFVAWLKQVLSAPPASSG